MAKSKFLFQCTEGEWVYFYDAQLVQVRLCNNSRLIKVNDKARYKFILDDPDRVFGIRDNYNCKVFPLSIYTKRCAFRIHQCEEYARKKGVWSYPHKPADKKYGDWSQYLAEQFAKLASLDAEDPLQDNNEGYKIIKEIYDMIDKTAKFYEENPKALAEGNLLAELLTALEES